MKFSTNSKDRKRDKITRKGRENDGSEGRRRFLRNYPTILRLGRFLERPRKSTGGKRVFLRWLMTEENSSVFPRSGLRVNHRITNGVEHGHTFRPVLRSTGWGDVKDFTPWRSRYKRKNNRSLEKISFYDPRVKNFSDGIRRGVKNRKVIRS